MHFCCPNGRSAAIPRPLPGGCLPPLVAGGQKVTTNTNTTTLFEIQIHQLYLHFHFFCICETFASFHFKLLTFVTLHLGGRETLSYDRGPNRGYPCLLPWSLTNPCPCLLWCHVCPLLCPLVSPLPCLVVCQCQEAGVPGQEEHARPPSILT